MSDAAMHDNPQIFPTLPPKAEPVTAEMWRLCVESHATDDPWRSCWEYVLTHHLSETEGAAFWTGANLVFEAMKPYTAPLTPAQPPADHGDGSGAGGGSEGEGGK